MEKNKSSFWLGFFVGLAAVSILCFIGLLIFVLGQSESVDLAEKVQAQPQPQAQGQPEQPQPEPVQPISEGEYVKGNKDAKVQIIEYSDYECPFCARHTATMQQLAQEYGDKVAIVFRNFPLSFHQNAQKAAEAAECAGLQGKFWEMYDKLFALNESGTMSVDEFKKTAANLGLNTSDFNNCLDNGDMTQKIANDMIGAQKAGVSGTPGTFINGKLLSGALPIDEFKQEIDNALNE